MFSKIRYILKIWLQMYLAVSKFIILKQTEIKKHNQSSLNSTFLNNIANCYKPLYLNYSKVPSL